MTTNIIAAGITKEAAGFERFDRVTANIKNQETLWRSSSPYYSGSDGSHHITKNTIAFLHDKKIKHIISFNNEATRDDIVKALGGANIVYTPLKVKDFTSPDEVQLKAAFQAFKQHTDGTLIWCGAGYGRTGTGITAIQIFERKQQLDEDNKKKKKKSPYISFTHKDYGKNDVEEENEEGESTKQYETLDGIQRGYAAGGSFIAKAAVDESEGDE